MANICLDGMHRSGAPIGPVRRFLFRDGIECAADSSRTRQILDDEDQCIIDPLHRVRSARTTTRCGAYDAYEAWMRSGSSNHDLRSSQITDVVLALSVLGGLLLWNVLLQRYFQPVWVWAHGGPPRTPDLDRIILRDTLKFWIGGVGFPFATAAVTAFLALSRRYAAAGPLRSGLMTVGLAALYVQLTCVPEWTHCTRAAVHEQVLRKLNFTYLTAIDVLPMVIAVFFLVFAASIHDRARRGSASWPPRT